MLLPSLCKTAKLSDTVKSVAGSDGKRVCLLKNPEEIDYVQKFIEGKRINFVVQECVTGYFLSLELLELKGPTTNAGHVPRV